MIENLSIPAGGKPEGVKGIDREQFQVFLIHECRLLDERLFEQWIDLFTNDGVYWVPSTPGQTDPYNTASLFFDDRALMKTRIERLRHPRIHIQTPHSRTNHLLGNVIVEYADKKQGIYLVSSSFMMGEYRLDNQRIFMGRQFHKLIKNDDTFKIIFKRVDLINCESAFEAMAVPI